MENDAVAYGVEVEQAEVSPGEQYWAVERVHHLTPQENHGNHHIFFEVLDESGKRILGARVRVTWEGGGEEIVALESASGQYAGDFPMWKHQVCSVEMVGMPSDRVLNIHTAHPDEGEGNTLFHHSFAVTFRRVRAEGEATVTKTLDHYVLFGKEDAPGTTANLLVSLEYLLAFTPAFGFSAEDAASARKVTIIGDESHVSADQATALESSGSWLERISGKAEDIADLLLRRVAARDPFGF